MIMKINKYAESVYTAWSPELTLDFKEIMLNSEWYYKVSKIKTHTLYKTLLTTFALVWISYFTYHLFCLASNLF